MNGVRALALMKLDVLDEFETVNICVKYRIGKKIYSDPPLAMKDLSVCEPVYERMDGWKQTISSSKSLDDLPENAKRYIKRLEELIGVPVGFLSTGPQRDRTLVLQNPFLP
jgi:adenylosuccinate synthase